MISKKRSQKSQKKKLTKTDNLKTILEQKDTFSCQQAEVMRKCEKSQSFSTTIFMAFHLLTRDSSSWKKKKSISTLKGTRLKLLRKFRDFTDLCLSKRLDKTLNSTLYFIGRLLFCAKKIKMGLKSSEKNLKPFCCK